MDDGPRRSLAFISVGSNIEPQRNIPAALELLVARTEVAGSSTFYRTEPIGRPGQPMFVNGVWQIRTDLEPSLVQDELLRPIERRLGRRRTADKFAPRPIDLDLVLYDDRISDDGGLRLLHPDIVRSFVLWPIVELLEQESSAVKPELKSRIKKLLPETVPEVRPGEILIELTGQLRELLAG